MYRLYTIETGVFSLCCKHAVTQPTALFNSHRGEFQCGTSDVAMVNSWTSRHMRVVSNWRMLA